MSTLVITRLAMIIHAIVVKIKLPISFRRTVITAWIVGKSEPILIFKRDLIGIELMGSYLAYNEGGQATSNV